MPPSSTPALGDGMGQELGGKPSPTSRSRMHAGASRRCSRPSHQMAAARLKPWLQAAKLPPRVPCPLSWSSLCLSPSLGAARGERILQAMKQQQIPPAHPSSTSPLPSLAALQRLLFTACPGRSRAGGAGTHRDSQANSCPLKRGVSWGPPAQHGDPHRHLSSRGTGRRGRQGQGLPSRRHSSCCHRFCLLERGGRRLGEPGRAPRPGGQGSAAWCQVAEWQDPAGPASGFRPLSSNPWCSPQELRGDLAGRVPSYPSGSWPGA